MNKNRQFKAKKGGKSDDFNKNKAQTYVKSARCAIQPINFDAEK